MVGIPECLFSIIAPFSSNILTIFGFLASIVVAVPSFSNLLLPNNVPGLNISILSVYILTEM